MKIHMEREVAGKIHRVGLKRKSVVLVMFLRYIFIYFLLNKVMLEAWVDFL